MATTSFKTNICMNTNTNMLSLCVGEKEGNLPFVIFFYVRLRIPTVRLRAGKVSEYMLVSHGLTTDNI